MKINFIIPFTGKSGGIKMVYEYANRLSERGHDVVLFTPVIGYKFNNNGICVTMKRIKIAGGNIFKRGTKVNWFDLKVTLRLVPIIRNRYIRDADIVIATAWPTAYDVFNLSKYKGNKFYFIQHYEIWSGKKEDVDGSYLLPLKQIVIADWIKKLMNKNFGRTDSEIVYNGIDFNEFSNDNKIFSNKTVCIMYHVLDWKGYSDGLKAFEIVKSKIPDLKLILFGMENGPNIPDYAEFHLDPNKQELKEIYCKSDIFIFPSRNEGWGLTPLEAMACKCVVVGTNTGAVKELGNNGVNMMISEPEDIDNLAENLYKVLTNLDLLKKISNNGYNTVLDFSWDKSVDKFEKILANSVVEI
jgi:glycosyltransferase involved in cell wall biosynthesis